MKNSKVGHQKRQEKFQSRLLENQENSVFHLLLHLKNQAVPAETTVLHRKNQSRVKFVLVALLKDLNRRESIPLQETVQVHHQNKNGTGISTGKPKIAKNLLRPQKGSGHRKNRDVMTIKNQKITKKM